MNMEIHILWHGIWWRDYDHFIMPYYVSKTSAGTCLWPLGINLQMSFVKSTNQIKLKLFSPSIFSEKNNIKKHSILQILKFEDYKIISFG